MTNQFASILIKDKISDFRIRKPLCVNKADTLKTVLKKMKKERRGSALVEKNGKLVGIFTERDLLKRVIPNRIPLKTSIEAVMSEKPVTLCASDSMAMVLSVMNETGVRHIPIVHRTKGTIEGIISVRDVLDYLADHFPNEVYNLPPDLNQVSREPEGA